MADLSPLHQMTASCVGAVMTSVFMTPFDVVKVRLQAQQRAQLSRSCFLYCNGLMDHLCRCQPSPVTAPSPPPWYTRPVPPHLNGTLDAFVKISQREGVQSLWSGLSPTLVVAVPNTVIYFTTYEQLKAALLAWGPTQPLSPSLVGGVAGGLARVWSVTIVSPFELVRTKMQASTISYTELQKVLQSQVSSMGILSLWRGWIPTILRDVPFSMVYWLSYEKMKSMFLQHHHQPSFQFTLIAGGVAGGVAGALTLPLDVIKTHRQIELETSQGSSRTGALLGEIYRRQGVAGLFSGLVPRLAKVVPACALMISTYEYAKRLISTRQAAQQ